MPSLQKLLVSLGRRLGENVLNRTYITLFALRSFRGHLSAAIAAKRYLLDAGPAFEPVEPFLPNRRTIARISGIEALRATHPWVDHTDLRMFLAGFEAGEEWNSRSSRTEPENTTYQNPAL